MATNQERLNAVLTSISDSLAVVVAELKEHASHGEVLDFTAADALVAAAAQAAADAQAIPDPDAPPPPVDPPVEPPV